MKEVAMSVSHQPAIASDTGDPLGSYGAAMEHLASAISTLSTMAKTLLALTTTVAATNRRVINAGGGGLALVLRNRDRGYCVDDSVIAPLGKEQHYPTSLLISGWTIDHAYPVVIPNLEGYQSISYGAYQPILMRDVVMVPQRMGDPVGMIETGWSRYHEASPDEVRLLQVLADSTAVALANIRLYTELEQRIQTHTAALELEVEEHKQAEAQVRHLSLTDELTGLNNRRGFYVLGELALEVARRNGTIAWLIFLDLDGLKQVNDHWGHEAGDRAIAAAATLLRETFRTSDVVARIGGDEFAILAMTNTETPTRTLCDRLQSQVRHYNQAHVHPFQLALSIGVECCQRDDQLADVLGRADAKMYVAKRQKRTVLGNSSPHPSDVA